MECEVFGIVPLDIAGGNDQNTLEHKGTQVQFSALFESAQTDMFSQYITERLISQALQGRHAAHILVDSSVEQFTALARDLVVTSLEESSRCRVSLYHVTGEEAWCGRNQRMEFKPSLILAQPFGSVGMVEVRNVGELDSKVGLVDNIPGQYELLCLSVGFDVIPSGVSGGGASKLFPEISILLFSSDHPHISRSIQEIPRPSSKPGPLNLPPSSSLAANVTSHFLSTNHHCSATFNIKSLLNSRVQLLLAQHLKSLRTFPIVNDSYSKGLLLRATQNSGGTAADTVDAGLVRRLKDDLQAITKDNVRLLGENEQLHQNVDKLGIDLNNLLGSKQVLSAEVREKLQNEQEIYNKLTEMAVEKVKIRDVSDTKRYELMNKIFSLENDLLNAQIQVEEWREKCLGAEGERSRVEQYRDDLQREYVVMKGNYHTMLGKQTSLEKRCEELSLELVHLHMNQNDLPRMPSNSSIGILPAIKSPTPAPSSEHVLQKPSNFSGISTTSTRRSEVWGLERAQLVNEIAELKSRLGAVEGSKTTQKKLLQRAIELEQSKGCLEERRGELEGKLSTVIKDRDAAVDELDRVKSAMNALSVVKSRLEAETVALRLKQRNAVEEFRARLDCYIRDTERYLNRKETGELRGHLAKMVEDYKKSHTEREADLLDEINVAKANLNDTLERYHKLDAGSGSNVNLRLVQDEVTRLRERCNKQEARLQDGTLLPLEKVEGMLTKQQRKYQQTIEQLRVKLHKSESQVSRFMQYL